MVSQTITKSYLVQQKKAFIFKKFFQPSAIMILTKSLIIILILNQNLYYPVFSQLSGREKTMEQFLDRLLHESVYDKRIRPFYTDNKSKITFNIFFNLIRSRPGSTCFLGRNQGFWHRL